MPGLTFPDHPNERALKALDRRGLKLEPSGNWYEVWQQQHQTAFTVAQSAGYDILGDIYAAVRMAINNGITFEQFRDELTPILQAKGWWGKTADGKFLGTPWRLKTIFQTNLRVSFAQGEWSRIQELKEDMPYIRYEALLDNRTRPLHASWDGIILPVDHPWWKTHFPPNGWNCRCRTVCIDDAYLKYEGLKVTENPPDDGSREWINPYTGEVVQVPNGIDPGWAYNPGEIDQAAESAKIAMDKLAALPPEAASQAIKALAPAIPQVQAELKTWIKGITDEISKGIYHPKGERRVVGALPEEAINYAAEIGFVLATAAISIGELDLMHALRTKKVDPLPIDVWENIPELLQNAEAIYWEKGANTLVYVINNGSGKFVVQLNNLEEVKKIVGGKRRKEKIITNTIRTGRRISNLEEFKNLSRYKRLK